MLQKTKWIPRDSPFTFLRHTVGTVSSPWWVITFGINIQQAAMSQHLVNGATPPAEATRWGNKKVTDILK
jgi:hypothetical protein